MGTVSLDQCIAPKSEYLRICYKYENLAVTALNGAPRVHYTLSISILSPFFGTPLKCYLVSMKSPLITSANCEPFPL